MSSAPQQSQVTTYEAPENHDLVKELDRLDEMQIVEAMKGRAIDKLFHELPMKDPKTGENVIQLSWAGVKYFTLQLKSISVEKIELTESQDTYRAVAWAYDKTRDVRVTGGAEQSKKMALRDGRIVSDEFAYAKVISKAQRNALRNLLSESLITEGYRIWKEQHRLPTQSELSTGLKGYQQAK